MTNARAYLILAAACAMTSASAGPVMAQGWTADLYAGGTRYGALVDHVSVANLIGGVRYRALSGSIAYVSIAAPLDANAAPWGAAGARHGFRTSELRPAVLGLDLGGSVYGFRAEADGLGGGASLYALPTVTLKRGGAAFELRAGRHQHLFSRSDTSGSRGLYEAGARLLLGQGVHGAALEARWLRASETTYPYVGVHVTTGAGPARFWASGGRWLSDALDDATWNIGASVSVGHVGELWAGVRHDAVDPLYLTTARRSWNIGYSRIIGSRRAAMPALAPKVEAGRVRIRLPLHATDDATPSVAGEFSDWKPIRMRRDGDGWILEIPLASGVYRFAFVGADGEWFVPEHYTGRIDDGMGGHLALLVVP